MTEKRVYVRGYHGTMNLGDAIQTYALCRLVPGTALWLSGEEPPDLFVVNGWLGRHPFWNTRNTVFAGVFLSPDTHQHYRWAARTRFPPVGARDSFTFESLKSMRVPTELVGCATMTLPKYTGPRSGELHIDDDTPGCMTNGIAKDASWEDQWRLAVESIDRLRHAAVVYTKRLHVALPCLAMGTPVLWRKSGDHAAERFSILETMGVPEGRVTEFDLSPWADRYKKFLADRVAIVADREPERPDIHVPQRPWPGTLLRGIFRSVIRGLRATSQRLRRTRSSVGTAGFPG